MVRIDQKCSDCMVFFGWFVRLDLGFDLHLILRHDGKNRRGDGAKVTGFAKFQCRTKGVMNPCSRGLLII